MELDHRSNEHLIHADQVESNIFLSNRQKGQRSRSANKRLKLD